MKMRLPAIAFLAILASAIVIPALACSSDNGARPGARPVAAPSEPASTPGSVGIVVPEDAAITVYRTPTCGCCAGYEEYLKDLGFQVDGIVIDDVDSLKDDLQIPEDMWSCHTSLVGDYFVEGHVPAEAIVALLDERPAIDGIVLPGMPAGSPGMGGDKSEPFVIYSITDGEAEEFMTI
jgi:hypothetical protein